LELLLVGIGGLPLFAVLFVEELRPALSVRHVHVFVVLRVAAVHLRLGDPISVGKVLRPLLVQEFPELGLPEDLTDVGAVGVEVLPLAGALFLGAVLLELLGVLVEGYRPRVHFFGILGHEALIRDRLGGVERGARLEGQELLVKSLEVGVPQRLERGRAFFRIHLEKKLHKLDCGLVHLAEIVHLEPDRLLFHCREGGHRELLV
jgi:hypothetical protein